MQVDFDNFHISTDYHEVYRVLPDSIQLALNKVVEHEAKRWHSLLQAFPTSPVKTFDSASLSPVPVGTFEDIEKLANDIRNAWDLGSHAIIHQVDEVLQYQGILVVVCEIHPHAALSSINGRYYLQGEGISDPVGTPFIIVDHRLTLESQQYHLAQELGRILLHDRITRDLKQEMARIPCDRRTSPEQRMPEAEDRRKVLLDGHWDHYFATAFLLPNDLLRRYLGEKRSNIDPRELDFLHGLFGINSQYLLWRAKNAKILHEELCIYHQSSPYHAGNKSHKLEKHQTSVLFLRLLYRGLSENYLTESDAAKLLDLTLDEFLALN